jgi:hypothetical protein
LTRSLEEVKVSISKESFGSSMNASFGGHIIIKRDADTWKSVDVGLRHAAERGAAYIGGKDWRSLDSGERRHWVAIALS